ncbi:hypothetical protein HUA74_05685 [Myxococcus sp. CA051A]|uniref:SMI1/KNR4 family protein n=1 Tax=Myxococcus sp. CA051A TaxID=2741739 RepID=UPI00157AD7E2|nr:SMI1/KNR4 family protein [Myxococcus sp. CA051A]NTX60144.1 hypothetical protein [Myxococcus sp. CA051A]
MDKLTTLLERFSPGYQDRIEGYPDWLIDELEEVFGQPLPVPYREFARSMGVSGGPLLAHVRSYDPLLNVAELYRLSPQSELPPRTFLFIFGDPDPLAPTPYWLDLESPSEDGDYQVVRMPFGEHPQRKLHRDFVSFREMLFLWAMEYVHLPNFPHQARYHRGKDLQASTVEDLVRILEKTGFERLPYPRYSMLFERDDAAIRLYRPPDDSTFDIRVGMHSAEQLRHFQALIEDNTDLKRSTW